MLEIIKTEIFSITTVMVKPILRYIGGKYSYGKKLDELGLIPNDIDTYVEPFVGGGGMMCYILNTRKPKKIIINDKDPLLINFYRWLKKNKNVYDETVVYKHITKNAYDKCITNINKFDWTMKNSQCYFVAKSSSFNSAIYQNKDGKYSGSYSTANSYFRNNIKSDIHKMHDVLQKSEIHNKEYFKITPVKAFIVLDPPYIVPDVQRYYVEHTIKLQDIYKYFKKLDDMGNKILLFMNYSDDAVLRFKGYRQTVLTKNAKHLKGGGGNGKLLKELVITNY